MKLKNYYFDIVSNLEIRIYDLSPEVNCGPKS